MLHRIVIVILPLCEVGVDAPEALFCLWAKHFIFRLVLLSPGSTQEDMEKSRHD